MSGEEKSTVSWEERKIQLRSWLESEENRILFLQRVFDTSEDEAETNETEEKL
jgi:hypothetical protein